jgi:hypothetical protein
VHKDPAKVNSMHINRNMQLVDYCVSEQLTQALGIDGKHPPQNATEERRITLFHLGRIQFDAKTALVAALVESAQLHEHFVSTGQDNAETNKVATAFDVREFTNLILNQFLQSRIQFVDLGLVHTGINVPWQQKYDFVQNGGSYSNSHNGYLSKYEFGNQRTCRQRLPMYLQSS